MAGPGTGGQPAMRLLLVGGASAEIAAAAAPRRGARGRGAPRRDAGRGAWSSCAPGAAPTS